MPGRGISILAAGARILPQVKKPLRKVSFKEKLFWTGLVVIIYLIMAEIPLYGVGGLGSDPFAMMRVIFASRRGTLMELGIGPIVTAGLILQMLAGSRLINIDFSKPEDRSTFTAANKVFAIIMTAFEAGVFIIGGVYGRLDPMTSALIFIQLLLAGIMVILLDELIQKGWGLGSGISLFIAAGVCQQMFWQCVSPLPAGDGFLFGALLAFGQSIAAGDVTASIFRGGSLPDMVGFISTIIIFVVIVYLEGLRVDIPVSHARFRGYRGTYPVKFFYVSNIPVILASALFADVYFAASILSANASGSFLSNIVGTFDVNNQPIGGLAYYLTSPRSIPMVAADPLRAAVYAIAMIAVCMLFSITWVEVGGLGSKKVAKQLISSGMQIPGFRRAERPIRDVLDRYIPTVTVLGGATVGVIAAVADFVNTFGTGIGILLTTGIIWQYYQLLARERIEEMYPGLSKLIGRT
jgi:preprotein translocase SecY subunit